MDSYRGRCCCRSCRSCSKARCATATPLAARPTRPAVPLLPCWCVSEARGRSLGLLRVCNGDAEPVVDTPAVRVGRKRSRLTGPTTAPAAKAAKPSGPPPKLDLGQLPAGVPEEVPIFCNGRTAVLHVRQQKVRCDGELMPPSRFEQVCGKGDAKKWKATLFHYDTATEQPTVCMQVCMLLLCLCLRCVCAWRQGGRPAVTNALAA